MRFAVRATLGTSLALSACAVGPNYKAPAAPATQGYTREALPAQTSPTQAAGGEVQHFQFGQELPADWWRLFESAELNALIEQAIKNYPSIAAQQAALRQARDNVRAQQGVFFPQIQGQGTAARQKESLAAAESGLSVAPQQGLGSGQTLAQELEPYLITNLYTASVSVSYTFDIFGGERRQLESLQAQVDAQKYQLEASYLTLTSNVAATAIQMASVREQIAATQEIVALEEKQLALIERQFQIGIRARADVLQQQSNLATVRATLPALQQQLSASDHQLAVLVGQFPHDSALVQFTLSDLKLPADLPVSLPSGLVARRPDIKVQEMAMRQANAAVGVATANLLPQLTLQAQTGDQSALFSTVFTPAAAMWGLTSTLTQPIFAGGTLRARRRAAIDAYDQTQAQYRLAVLNAFQNVADALTALENDAQAVGAQFDAQTAAKSSLDLIQRQYDAGAVGYVSLLTAQQTYQQARISYVKAVASRYADTVALFQALGGGWWSREQSAAL